MNADKNGYGRIVVGVDGSPASRHALRWASREALLRDCPVEVVFAWKVSTEPRPTSVPPGIAPPLQAYQQQAAQRIEQVVAETVPEAARAKVVVRVVHGGAGRVLLERAEQADLLVLASKGRGRLTAWLLGSISDEALHRAPCSVVIVRPPEDVD